MRIDVYKEDFESVVICALRYCLGRRTYMPSIAISFACQFITKFSDKALYVIEKDIESANNLGDETIDKPLWLEFLGNVKKERELRRLNEHN